MSRKKDSHNDREPRRMTSLPRTGSLHRVCWLSATAETFGPFPISVFNYLLSNSGTQDRPLTERELSLWL